MATNALFGEYSGHCSIVLNFFVLHKGNGQAQIVSIWARDPQ